MTRASACAAPCRQDLRSCPAHHKRYTRPPWGAENRVTVFENAKGLARSGGGRPTPAGADAPGPQRWWRRPSPGRASITPNDKSLIPRHPANRAGPQAPWALPRRVARAWSSPSPRRARGPRI